MSKATYLKNSAVCGNVKTCLLGFFLAIVPSISAADIIWSGGFETGDFTQWHSVGDPDAVYFFQMPEYGRPIQYGGQQRGHAGNGDLLSLEAKSARTVNGIFYPQGPTRGGDYAAKFTVKTAANYTEPNDCDVVGCSHRRTQLTMQAAMQSNYNGLPNMGERWMSVSIYLPSDFEISGSGFGPQYWEIKPTNDGGSGDTLGILINSSGSWVITHNWQLGQPKGFAPYQQQMGYSANYPTPSSDWPDGNQDFAVAGSQAALGTINRGGWTDWVFHLKFDSRGSNQGGTGYLDLWKRDGSGPWEKILALIPRQTTRMGSTFNRGIGTGAPGGYGPKVGPYMDTDRVRKNSNNMVVYLANMKIGDEKATFADMSHDGSSPNSESMPAVRKPNPPLLQTIE